MLGLPPSPADPKREALSTLLHASEAEVVERLLRTIAIPPEARARIDATARRLVAEVRERRTGGGGLDAFLQEYDLSSREGVVLMCLAEALLRIPDADDRRPADPRQDRRGRLGRASRQSDRCSSTPRPGR